MSEGFPEEIVAPHGRAVDGTPLAPYGYGTRGHPRKRALSPGDRRFRANKAGRAGGKRTTRKGSPVSPRMTADSGETPDFTDDITGLLQLAAFPLSMAEATVPDAWAINRYAPGIGSALNELAQERPEIAAMLMRLQQAGPYAALVAAVTPLVAQLLANHRILPAALVGAATREEIMEDLAAETIAQREAENAEDEEWAREAMRRAAEAMVPDGVDEWPGHSVPEATKESPPVEFHRQPEESPEAFFGRVEAQTGVSLGFTGASDADEG